MPTAKRYKSAQDKKAQADHQKWLKSQGIRPSNKSRSQLRGVPIPADLTYRSPDIPGCSTFVGGAPVSDSLSRATDNEYQEAVKQRARSVAPSFNKGPLQPQTNRDLFDSQRRS